MENKQRSKEPIIVDLSQSCSSSSDDNDEDYNKKEPSCRKQMPLIDLSHDDDTSSTRNTSPCGTDYERGSSKADTSSTKRVPSPSVAAIISQQQTAPSDDDDVVVLEVRNTKKRRRRQPSFRCDICLEDNLEEWRGYALANCYHRFCLVCLSNHVRLATSTKIRCPACPKHIALLDIRNILQMMGNDNDSTNKKEDQARLSWQSYSERASLALLEQEIAVGNSGTRHCPAERCNFTFVYEETDSPEGTQFDCPQCKKSFCLNCGANEGRVGPAHPQMTCYDRREQLQKEEEERRKLEEWKRENAQADVRFRQLLEKEARQGLTKPCPKCKAPITKNGGCNHMKCSQCGLDYDWSSNNPQNYG